MTATIDDQRQREAARRTRAAQVARGLLATRARRLTGSYIMYGPAVTGTMRHDSNVDLLLAFPPGTEAEAWQTAEDVLAELALPYTIMPLGWTAEKFRNGVWDRVLHLG